MHQLTPNSPFPENTGTESYQEVLSRQKDQQWQQLANITAGQALEAWLQSLSHYTEKSYRSGFRLLAERSVFDPNLSLQEFSLVNHEAKVDDIKLSPHWSEATRQARAAAYIGFTAFLQRRTQGLIHKAISNREGANKTFFKVRDKVKTNYLNELEVAEFFKHLESLNQRDALIAKLILQGGKRKGEVLSLLIEQIDFRQRLIRFKQSKTKGAEKETWITYPESVMTELKNYLTDRIKGLCFVTRNNRQISPNQLDRNFIKAGEIAGIPFPVTPHVLRVTLVTKLKGLDIQDSDIIKITGHASPVQLLAYDRRDPADNASKQFSFF